MKQYAKMHIDCTSRKKADKQIYKEFKERMKKYLLDEDMELYRIPILSKDYQYAHELSKQYAWDWSRDDDMEDYPGLYITDSGIIETDYTRKDYEQAVAYLVNFWYISYTYEYISDSDYEGPCCEKPKWKYQNGLIQNKLYRIPASEFKNKKYAKIMFGYIVHEEVKQLLIDNHLASEQDFQKVITKKGETVCYQLKPENVITGFAQDNHMDVFDYCRNCGLIQVHFGEEPYYMSKDTLKQLKGLNRTKETEGPIFIDKSMTRTEPFNSEFFSSLDPLYIVNKDTYNLLHANYPRMQFIPIFAKDENV